MTEDDVRTFMDDMADTLANKNADYGHANEKAAVLKRLFAIDGEIEVINTADGREAVVLGEPYDVRGLEEEALDGIFTRFLDKVSRAHRLTFHHPSHVDSEPAIDAYDDIVGYAVRMAMLARGEGGFKHHGRLKANVGAQSPWVKMYDEIQEEVDSIDGSEDEVKPQNRLDLAYGTGLQDSEEDENPWAEFVQRESELRRILGNEQ